MSPAPDLDPDAVAALAEAYETGLAHEKAGRRERAAEAYARALAIDPDDRGGVAVRLAALGLGEAPDRAPPAYVETLFDQHADRFDEFLVGQLSYRTPWDMAEALGPLGPFARMLDLGCGTGLCGETLAPITEHRTGVDLAENMLAEADARAVYDDLYLGDALGFLEAAAEEGESWNLIVAADVLPYLGELGPLFAAAAERLEPGGALCVSTELLDGQGGARGWGVTPRQRYAHAEPYLRRTLAAAGLETRAVLPIVVRTDEGRGVRGQLVVASKPGA